MNDDELLKKRFIELAERSEKFFTYEETKFLSMAEQSELMKLGLNAELIGGYDSAERRIAVFGSEETTGYPYESPIKTVKIAPKAQKFAEQLTHRDFLGSLMALGITREMLGDIQIYENEGYLFCLGSIAEYVCANLTEVRRTPVKCTVSELPEKLSEPPAPISCVIASERLDAIIAAVYKISRDEAKKLAEKELVFINGRLTVKGSAQLTENDVISVRGKGRFVFLGIERETKKGKLRVTVRRY